MTKLWTGHYGCLCKIKVINFSLKHLDFHRQGICHEQVGGSWDLAYRLCSTGKLPKLLSVTCDCWLLATLLAHGEDFCVP